MRRIISIILILIICSMAFTSYAENIEELQEQQNNIQEQLNTAAEELEEIDSELSQNLQQVQKMDKKIEEYEKSLNELNNNISLLEQEFDELIKNVKKVEESYNTKKKLLDERLVTIYEEGNTRYLDVLLSSSSISEFISNYYLITLIISHDSELLDSVEKEKKELELKQKSLEIKKSNLEKEKQTQIKISTIISNSKIIRETYVEKLSLEEKELQAKIDEYHFQIQNIENQIKLIASDPSSNYIGGEMIWPIPNHNIITSKFGMRTHPITGVYKLHTGIDISAPTGTDFLAIASGIVTKAEYNKAYGNMVIVDHGGGIQTLYAHGSSIEVKVGQLVSQGDVVIKVGSTGYSTGPHAHLEVRKDGEPQNPLNYIKNP